MRMMGMDQLKPGPLCLGADENDGKIEPILTEQLFRETRTGLLLVLKQQKPKQKRVKMTEVKKSMYTPHKIAREKFCAIRDHVIVHEMLFDARITNGGIYIPNDNGKGR